MGGGCPHCRAELCLAETPVLSWCRAHPAPSFGATKPQEKPRAKPLPLFLHTLTGTRVAAVTECPLLLSPTPSDAQSTPWLL